MFDNGWWVMGDGRWGWLAAMSDNDSDHALDTDDDDEEDEDENEDSDDDGCWLIADDDG